MDASITPQFGGLIWTLLAFVIALSVIVAIHEYGHYIVGRWCGIKADVFSIGFGPVVFKRTDKHGTQWQLAALPLGGYVKFRGDGNAASVGDDGTVADMTPEEREATMTGARLWKRSATVAAGPVFNFILSIAVFAGFLLIAGRTAETAVVGAVKPLPAQVQTLDEGDVIVGLNGTPLQTLVELRTLADQSPLAPTVTYQVERDGQVVDVEAGQPLPARVDVVHPRSAAWDIGIRPDDLIVSIGDQPLWSFQHLQGIVSDSNGAPLDLQVWRNGELLDFTIVPRRMDLPTADGGFETRWLLGINGGLFFDPVTDRAGVWESVTYGVEQTIFIVQSSLSALGHIITGQISTCNLSGPIGIAEVSGATASQGIDQFIWFIAVLSTAVGLMNLFPIPILDGGHLVFHAYEAVAGRPPSDKAVRLLMGVGLAMMGTLMIFAVFNDLFCP
ncbi:MAG: RIP metalloprotease RseP [Pseudomonadota bacterium]